MREFFDMHGMQPDIVDIDGTSTYFCVQNEVTVKQKWYRDFNARRTKA